MANWSQTWTWYRGAWSEGNTPILGPRSHSFWLGSSVFDGARAFEGVAPDLDLHCARVNQSAKALGLKPTMPASEIVQLAKEGIAKFPDKAELYIRPMYWAEEGGPTAVAVDPDSTEFLLTLYEVPMPKPTGFSITKSPFRRPTIECMPVNAKAGCLYPNNGRALVEARARGFDNCLLLDFLGNVAELATANIFLAKNGVVKTPIANGTFLSGITRQRVIKLLRDAGVEVQETVLDYAAFEDADEIFSTGNASKVIPATRIDARELQPGPFFRRARELYWQFAHAA
ncbi:branched-chain amino acid aminotransferase [Methylovirgula sp. 4M-Z18]|uniref:branched-chain amino acid aminotransferase n=1 Tax=Methylovirgula sp. 4M-Z18 TaxID=2293567 RepID=UPI000E2E9B04|nr:branched-chain amino acid aminotransferase [Methylovirgula sp. 4M-Z18]RFB81323.1 branched-chain amino acid aminotransferase [Methylovirgula sp. 4M-Z18]